MVPAQFVIVEHSAAVYVPIPAVVTLRRIVPGATYIAPVCNIYLNNLLGDKNAITRMNNVIMTAPPIQIR